MITTRESINYQFSLIFGYSSPNDLIVGDVIGPGILTGGKVNELSQKVIEFLTMYNAMLRDYTGAEVFSIEFDLYNFDEKSAQVNIYPKSMIFIPGRYKDCESFLLALKPETGYLNVHRSRQSLNNISKLFFEIEEFTDRSELKYENKQRVYDKFAKRFSKKLYGELIEDKWNKKLIGLSKALPTEQEMLITYGKIKANVEILWHKKPIKIHFLNPKFDKLRIPFIGQQAIEHLKYSISEPSANFIVDKTLNLGTNLINLVNTGTLDESQDELLRFLISQLREKIKEFRDFQTAEWLISYVNRLIIDLQGYMNKFLEYSRMFLTTGEVGDLHELLNKFEHFIINKGKLENEQFEDICRITKKFIKHSVIQKKNLRIVELDSQFNYFSAIIKKNLNLIKTSLLRYLSYRRIKTLTIELIKNLKVKFSKEQTPAKVLGQKLIEKFNSFLFNQIEKNSILLLKDLKFNEKKLNKEFITLVNQNSDLFFDKIKLKIDDLISFAEVHMENDINIIKEHTEKFKKFSSELHYLLSYVLRHSTINRYLKEESEEEITDPITFANKFHRFLEKRIGGINLEWKFYVLEWITDYNKKFLKLEEKKNWNLIEIYNDFIGYFKERESKEQELENFLEFLTHYIAKVSNAEERNLLFEFYKQYELSIGINTEFPKYIKQIVKKELNNLNLSVEKLIPIDYFNLDKKDTFYNFIKNMELKYFSKLIPRPLTLTLKHVLTNEERENFNSDLFHVIDFKFWHNKVRFELANNFKEVYREWAKDL